MERLQSNLRRGYRFALKRLRKKGLSVPPPPQRREQFHRFLGKIQSKENPVVCVIGTDGQENLDSGIKLLYGNFDIASDENILDIVTRERIDAFYLNKCLPRDLVNLVNFLGIYGFDIPILMGDGFRCHSLVGCVPLMPCQTVTSSISFYNYFGKNYRINDTLLFQGYAYHGKELTDCHQFLLKPDETKVIDLEEELNIKGKDTGMYYLEVFHPQLPTSTYECRYAGIYRDKSSDFMAGTHSTPLGSWYDFGRESQTLARTFIPNLDNTRMRYVIPGWSATPNGSEIKAQTRLGNEVVFTASDGGGALEAVINCPNPSNTAVDLQMDRVWPGLPILGGQGFQTLWLEGKGLAVWHDGAPQAGFKKRPGDTRKFLNPGADKNRPAGTMLIEEQQVSSEVSKDLTDIYQQRARYFAEAFPFLGHSYPDLHVVFSREQWVADVLNFDMELHLDNGELVARKPFTFNGSLQTVNLNRLFSDQLAEITQGYWLITADIREQDTDQGDLLYPSTSMIFGFWSDGERLYDSVHSLKSVNTVAFDLGLTKKSDIARRTGRIMSHSRKFAPFAATEDLDAMYWFNNVGVSEERIDAHIKLRLHGSQGLEGITSFVLPADSTRIISAQEILTACNIDCPRGTVWIESNDCNLFGLWFLKAGDGNGFAVDHFTGG